MAKSLPKLLLGILACGADASRSSMEVGPDGPAIGAQMLQIHNSKNIVSDDNLPAGALWHIAGYHGTETFFSVEFTGGVQEAANACASVAAGAKPLAGFQVGHPQGGSNDCGGLVHRLTDMWYAKSGGFCDETTSACTLRSSIGKAEPMWSKMPPGTAVVANTGANSEACGHSQGKLLGYDCSGYCSDAEVAEHITKIACVDLNKVAPVQAPTKDYFLMPGYDGPDKFFRVPATLSGSVQNAVDACALHGAKPLSGFQTGHIHGLSNTCGGTVHQIQGSDMRGSISSIPGTQEPLWSKMPRGTVVVAAMGADTADGCGYGAQKFMGFDCPAFCPASQDLPYIACVEGTLDTLVPTPVPTPPPTTTTTTFEQRLPPPDGGEGPEKLSKCSWTPAQQMSMIKDCTNKDMFEFKLGVHDSFVKPTYEPDVYGNDAHWRTFNTQKVGEGWTASCVAYARTKGKTCGEWCDTVQNMRCVRGMDDAHHQTGNLTQWLATKGYTTEGKYGGCTTLPASHDGHGTADNGCDQSFGTQICACVEKSQEQAPTEPAEAS